MDYYGQLQLPVSQILTTNVDHFTEYDREDLEYYTGAFLIGIRSDGTDLYLLKPDRYRKCSRRKTQAGLDLAFNNLFENGNVRFYYGKDGIVQFVLRFYAIQILKEYSSQVMARFQRSKSLTTK